MMLLLTVAVGEFLASRRQHAGITQALATAVYFFLDGVQVQCVVCLILPALYGYDRVVGFLSGIN